MIRMMTVRRRSLHHRVCLLAKGPDTELRGTLLGETGPRNALHLSRLGMPGQKPRALPLRTQKMILLSHLVMIRPKTQLAPLRLMSRTLTTARPRGRRVKRTRKDVPDTTEG